MRHSPNLVVGVVAGLVTGIGLVAAPVASAAPTATEPATAPQVEKTRSWYVVPVASVDTDDGAGAGLRAEYAKLAPDIDPYRWALTVHLFASNTGFHHHRLRFDGLGLGPTGLRLTVSLAWRHWRNDTYGGIGPATTRERAFVGEFDADDPARKTYRYSLLQPFAHVLVRQPLAASPWQLFWAFSPKWSVVEAYPGSLLEQDQPFGMEGGLTLQGMAGVLYDTREPEVAPERGLLLEVSGRGAPDLGGEAGGFGGVLGSVRAYASTGTRVVWAGRLMGESLAGTIPFWEMAHWGGALPPSSGAELVRGLRYGRFRGASKVVASGEVRLRVANPTVFGTDLGLELAPFSDAITVSGPEGTPGAWTVHPGAGLGGRVILDDTFVGRVDVAYGLDPVLEPDGTVTQEPTLGFYLAFDHPF